MQCILKTSAAQPTPWVSCRTGRVVCISLQNVSELPRPGFGIVMYIPVDKLSMQIIRCCIVWPQCFVFKDQQSCQRHILLIATSSSTQALGTTGYVCKAADSKGTLWQTQRVVIPTWITYHFLLQTAVEVERSIHQGLLKGAFWNASWIVQSTYWHTTCCECLQQFDCW